MPASSQRLAGKTAVITGTAGGQGRAAVARWAQDVASAHGQVHILYANAAVTRRA